MQTIYLDISNKGVVPTIYAKQGDVGRKFEVVLTDSGLPYIPANGSAFSVWYSGASGEGNYTDISDKSAFSVNGNKVIVEMITQMLSNDGEGILSLVLNDNGGNQIGLWNIRYVCESVPGANSEEAKEYYTAFSKAVDNLTYPDSSLSVSGKAADSAAVGAALANKAPAGYGLGQTSGEIKDVTNFSELDSIIWNGWYFVRFAQPFYIDGQLAQFFSVEVSAETPEHVHQTIKIIGTNYVLHRHSDNGSWSAIEWVNPPMAEDVEYRTTERFLGAPVYTKLINCGTISNNKRVTTGVGNVIRSYGRFGSLPIPFVATDGTYEVSVEVNNGFAVFKLKGFGENSQGYLQLWYTK